MVSGPIFAPSVYVPKGWFAHIYVEGSAGNLRRMDVQEAAGQNYIHVDWGNFGLGNLQSCCRIKPLSNRVHIYFENQVELRKQLDEEYEEQQKMKGE